jgi:hypothetical protein
MIQKIDPRLVLYGDMFQYWAAGKIYLSGENPYDYDNVSTLRNIAGYQKVLSEDAISMMLYPPWIFPILVPFSLISYSASRLWWLFFHIFIVFFASRTTWYLYNGQKRFELLAYVVAFSFTPTLYVLGIGHITTLHFIGIVIFLYYVNKGTWYSDLTAGFAVAFILLKPQLLFIFIIALSLWILINRRWRILLGVLSFITLNLSITLLFNHDIISQYLEAIIKYPMGTWATPTLGMLLRLYFGIDKNWLQILPSVLAILWILFYFVKSRVTWNWYKETPLLVLVCFAFSPYTWTYDMVILVIPLIYILILLIRARITIISMLSGVTYIAINFSALILHRTRADFWFFWLAPALLVWFYFTEKATTNALKLKTSQNTNLELNL